MNKTILIAVIATAALGIAATSVNVFAQSPTPNTNIMQRLMVNHQAVQQALESGDYNAWENALPAQAQSMMGQTITKDNFPKLVQMHKLMEDGKYDQASQLRQELGLPSHNGMGMMRFGDNSNK